MTTMPLNASIASLMDGGAADVGEDDIYATLQQSGL